MYYKVPHIHKRTKQIYGREGGTPPTPSPIRRFAARHVCVQRFYSQLRPWLVYVDDALLPGYLIAVNLKSLIFRINL